MFILKVLKNINDKYIDLTTYSTLKFKLIDLIPNYVSIGKYFFEKL